MLHVAQTRTVSIAALIVLVVVGGAFWWLNRPSQLEQAHRSLYDQVSVGPDGVHVDIGEQDFGDFADEHAVFVVRRDDAGPVVTVPDGFAEDTEADRKTAMGQVNHLIVSYTGKVNGKQCFVRAYPIQPHLGPELVSQVHWDPATQDAVAVDMGC